MKQFQSSAVVIDIEQQDDVCVLHCKGRFVAGEDQEYIRAKTDEIKRLNCSKVIADFMEVPAIGSMGITFLVGVYKSVGGQFVLTGARPFVHHVLDLTGLSGIIPLAADLAAGLAALRSVPSMANSRSEVIGPLKEVSN
jgi:anti-anti-sigma factor